MDVGNDWSCASILVQSTSNVLASFGFFHALDRDANDVDAFGSTLFDLSHSGFHISSQCCRHGLRREAVLRTDVHGADSDSPRFAPHETLHRLAIATSGD